MNLKLIALARLVATFFYLPILLLGFILYFVSKLIRLLSFLLVMNYRRAKDEIKYFWNING